MNKTILSLLLTSIGVGLGGCSTFTDANRDIDGAQAASKALIADVRAKATSGAVEIYRSQRISGEEISVVKKESLPPIFDRPFLYATRSAPPQEVIRTISLRTGIPAIVKDDGSTPASQGNAGLPTSGAPGAASASLLSIFAGGPITQRPMELEWDRSLKSLLDHLAITMNQYWKYEDGRIVFFKEETRTFSLNLPHGKKDVKASISLGSSGGDGGSSSSSSGSSGGSSSSSSEGSSVSVSSAQQVDPFSAVVNGVRAIIGEASQSQSPAAGMVGMPSPMGMSVQPTAGSQNSVSGPSGKIVSSPELGSLMVTAAPPILDRVAEYIDNVNKKFARNILIDVTVYNVSLTKENMAGANLDINRLIQRRFGEIGAAITPASLLSPISGVTPGQMVINRTRTDGTSTATMVVQAMSGIGDVSLVHRGQVIAINGQPSPLQVGNDITYLASSSTTQTDGAGSTTALQPGKSIVGMTANFLPTITSDNRILLQYQLNIATLMGMDQVVSGGSMIQTPNISKQSLQQQAFMRDGQSLVLFGYDQDQASQNTNASFAGFSRNADKKRQMTVIVVQVHTGGIN